MKLVGLVERIMQKFRRTRVPISEYDRSMQHDKIYPEAKAAYEREKEKALHAQAERVARVQRLGYDVENITRREHNVAQ